MSDESHLWVAKGDEYQDAGQFHLAKAAFRKAVESDASDSEPLIALAELHYHLGEFDLAWPLYDELRARIPGEPEICYNAAVCLNESGRPTEAKSRLLSCLQLNPAHENAADLFAEILISEGEASEAITLLEKLATRSDRHNITLGRAHQQQGNREKAIAYFALAASANPDDATLQNLVGALLKEQMQLERALPYLERSVALDPDNHAAYENLFQTRRDLCEWNEYEERLRSFLERCRRDIADGVMPPVAPFYALSLPFTQRECTEIAKLYGAKYAVAESEQIEPLLPEERPERLKIGYVTSNCHDHPGNHLICGLFAQHDRSRYECFVYSFGGKSESAYRQRVVRGADHFIDITELSDREAAECIASDNIHILIDLKGYTRNHRPGIFGYRPAPIQAGYLGFAGSTGLPSHDYILTDRIVSPEEEAGAYSEELVYLPHQYQVNDHLFEVYPGEITREQEALPADGFLFCCFNLNYKMEPTIWAAWMRILARVEGSYLWLLKQSESVEERLRQEAEAAGISGERILFAGRRPREQHLARQKLAGLFLDTLHYGAHTTATDALRMGVPVVTCPGNTFASRVGASLVTAAGLSELVADDLDHYEELAVELAQNQERLTQLSSHLKENVMESPLLNTPQFARGIEAAFEEMWTRTRGKSPKS